MHVVDVGPRAELAHLAGPLRRPPLGDPRHSPEMDEAEEEAGHAALDEALAEARRAGVSAEVRLERGRPEQMVVAVARAPQVALIAIPRQRP